MEERQLQSQVLILGNEDLVDTVLVELRMLEW